MTHYYFYTLYFCTLFKNVSFNFSFNVKIQKEISFKKKKKTKAKRFLLMCKIISTLPIVAEGANNNLF